MIPMLSAVAVVVMIVCIGVIAIAWAIAVAREAMREDDGSSDEHDWWL